MGMITAEMRSASNNTLFYALDKFIKSQPWKMFSTLFKSKDLTVYFDWLGEFSGVRKFKDSRAVQALRQHNFFLESEVWEKTIGVKLRTLRSSTGIGLIKPRIEQMAFTLAQHGNKLFFDFLKAGGGGQAGGGTKASYPWAGCYDTQTFFSNSHPVYDADPGVTATNDNIVTGTGVDTVAHVVADWESGQQAFYDLNMRDGEPIFEDGPGEKPFILCASEDIAIFTEAFLREFDTSNNRNPYFGQVGGVIPSARLNTSTYWDVNNNQQQYTESSWFIIRAGMPMMPFIMLEKEPWEAEWNEVRKFDDDQIRYGTRAEYNFGYGYWQMIQKVYNA